MHATGAVRRFQQCEVGASTCKRNNARYQKQKNKGYEDAFRFEQQLRVYKSIQLPTWPRSLHNASGPLHPPACNAVRGNDASTPTRSPHKHHLIGNDSATSALLTAFIAYQTVIPVQNLHRLYRCINSHRGGCPCPTARRRLRWLRRQRASK